MMKPYSMFDQPGDYSDDDPDMTSADTTLDSASGGDRFHDRRTNLRRRNIEALATSNAINAIQRRVSRVGQIDRRLLAREQECEGFGVDPYVDQPFNRPGAYDRRHRYTENSISQALRHTLRRKVGTSCHYREWKLATAKQHHIVTVIVTAVIVTMTTTDMNVGTIIATVNALMGSVSVTNVTIDDPLELDPTRVTQQAPGVKQQAPGVTQQAPDVTQQDQGVTQQGQGVTQQDQGVTTAGPRCDTAEPMCDTTEGLGCDTGGPWCDTGGPWCDPTGPRCDTAGPGVIQEGQGATQQQANVRLTLGSYMGSH
ncbi:hypothetical protein NP493_411g02011 [Ridgeia piscesae]|uniref:Uncharacterized protein n=1 Tax=Ridgeia piscesae TaxID=27915 RepID=A0AAD9L119_RIDPI|nr:hypothetical protein NP493_411g02011 [Ridgeia piscesae]